MRLILTSRVAAVLLATTIAIPTAGFAQGTPPAASQTPPAATTTPAPATQAPRTPTMHRSRPTQSPEARVEARIAQLHKDLSITPAQQGQWDQFAQVMRDNASAMDQALKDRTSKMQSVNAGESMQSYATLAELHAQGVQKLTAAFQTLYGSLSDAKKKAADMAFRPRERAHH